LGQAKIGFALPSVAPRYRFINRLRQPSNFGCCATGDIFPAILFGEVLRTAS
jgi:hypothetical protein